MVESMYEQLMDGHAEAAADWLRNATNKDGGIGEAGRHDAPQIFSRWLQGKGHFPFPCVHASLLS